MIKSKKEAEAEADFISDMNKIKANRKTEIETLIEGQAVLCKENKNINQGLIILFDGEKYYFDLNFKNFARYYDAVYTVGKQVIKDKIKSFVYLPFKIWSK